MISVASPTTSLQISAIIVVKDGERYLAQAIESALAQTLPPTEIIVVDGQSTDRTPRIAQSFSQVRYILQQNHGLANARNLGVSAARGSLIAFLDHDDLWVPDKLRSHVAVMVEHPSLGYTSSRLTFLVEDAVARAVRTDLQVPRNGSTPSALVAHAEVFAAVGAFDPAYRIGCDADWFVRARDLVVPTAQLDQVLVHKRLHERNLSIDAATNRQDMFRLIKQSLARQRLLSHGQNPPHHG